MVLCCVNGITQRPDNTTHWINHGFNYSQKYAQEKKRKKKKKTPLNWKHVGSRYILQMWGQIFQVEMVMSDYRDYFPYAFFIL